MDHVSETHMKKQQNVKKSYEKIRKSMAHFLENINIYDAITLKILQYTTKLRSFH